MRRRRSLRNVKKVVKKPETLSEMMKIALLIHEDGLVWVFHDKTLPDTLDWVDYDHEADKIYFIGRRGIPYDLGLNMKEAQKENLLNCEYLMAAHVENEDVKNMTLVPFITRKVMEKTKTEDIEVEETEIVKETP